MKQSWACESSSYCPSNITTFLFVHRSQCWKNIGLKMTLSVKSAFRRNLAWMQQTCPPLTSVYFLGDFIKCDNWGLPNFHSPTFLRSWVRFETNSKNSYNPLFRHTTSLPVMNNLNNPRRCHKPTKTTTQIYNFNDPLKLIVQEKGCTLYKAL